MHESTVFDIYSRNFYCHNLYQVIKVSPFTKFDGHIYAQTQRPNAMFYDDRVTVVITNS